MWPRLARTLSFVCLVAGLASAAVAAGPPRVDVQRPRRAEGNLLVDFRVTDLFGEGVRQSLESGLPAKVRFTVEVWRHRTRWWDALVDESHFGYRVLYDVLEETFSVYDESGRHLLTTAVMDQVEQTLAVEPGFEVLPMGDLGDGLRYYVLVEVSLELLTVAEVRDLQQWIEGSLRDDDRPGRWTGLSDQVLGIVKGKMGLGERHGLGKSVTFEVRELEAP